jgi:ligand-binding sensor domain-containing protein
MTGGLFKYDGSVWAEFTTQNSGIPCDFVRAISVDSSDRIWIGTLEGLSLFDGNSWQSWTVENSGILSNNISCIAHASNGKTYVGTINGGLLYFDNGVMNNYTLINNGVPDNSTIAIQIDALDRPWFATTSQGFYTDVGNLIFMTFNGSNSALPSNSLNCMYLDKDQNFYIGTQINGLVVRTNSNDWRNYTIQNSQILDNDILSISKDSVGNVWLGTYNSGLVRLKESYLSLSEITTDKLNVYPSIAQTSEDIYYHFPVNSGSLTITRSDGKCIYQKEFSGDSYSFSASELGAGTFLVTVSSAGTVYREKLLIF